MRVRLLAGEKKIEAIKVVRQYTGYPLKEAKDVVDRCEEFDVSETYLIEFVHSAHSYGATVVIGLARFPKAFPSMEDPVLAELRDLRREIAGLRKHLGMIAHE